MRRLKNPLSIFLLCVVGLLVAQVTMTVVLVGWFTSTDDVTEVEIASSAISAFFTGAAFAGVIYTIMLQRRELELQREELQLTREELKRSAEAQEKSEEALVKQAEALAETTRLNQLTQTPFIRIECPGTSFEKYFLMIELVNVTAIYDVTIACAAVYKRNFLNMDRFIEEKVLHEYKDDAKKSLEEYGSVVVSDIISYDYITNTNIVQPITRLPMGSEYMYVLLQFQDMGGNIRFQMVEFEDYDNGESLGPNILNPSNTVVIKQRISFSNIDNILDQLPQYIKTFMHLLKRGVFLKEPDKFYFCGVRIDQSFYTRNDENNH